MHINFSKTRQRFIFFVFIFLFAFLFTRLIYIQILRHRFFSDLAAKQQKIFVKLPPKRGVIYDRLNRILAIQLDTPSIYAIPKEITNKKTVARIMARTLDVGEDTVLERLKRDNYFAWLKRRVDPDLARRIDEMAVEGVYFTTEPKRFYPSERLACHVVGMTDIDNEGLEGVERYYNNELKGEAGWRRSIRDARRREIVSLDSVMLPPKDGRGIALTIDQVTQHIIEEEVEKIVKSYRPRAVSVVALDPKTGEVFGMANYPWFNPNKIANININFVRNRAITDSFEPGSVFKIVTASAALEEGAVNFDSRFFCENGSYKIGKRILHDYKPYATLTFREVIEKSSNIGTVKVADKVGRKKIFEYIKRYNFGSRTNIDLPGEVPGIMRNLSNWTPSDMTTVPMGQGIAVTTLQLASAVSAIANEGALMQPYVVKSFLNEDGVAVEEFSPKCVRQVISKDTADKVKELMLGVVERGTGKNARMENFKAGGKTGTAQKVNNAGGYYSDRYVSSFIGFAPYTNPRIALAVCVDEPHGQHFGSQVAAPAFKNIMEKTLSYMEVESDRNEIRKTY